MTRDLAVQFVGVSASRGGRPVLRNVSIDIGQSETVALVGRSGSGKTTLLRLINRLSEPDAGSVIVHGKPAHTWDPIALRRQVGYVIQDAGLFPHMTVASNISLVPRLLMWPAEKIAARVDELLRMVGLDPVEFALDLLPGAEVVGQDHPDDHQRHRDRGDREDDVQGGLAAIGFVGRRHGSSGLRTEDRGPSEEQRRPSSTQSSVLSPEHCPP